MSKDSHNYILEFLACRHCGGASAIRYGGMLTPYILQCRTCNAVTAAIGPLFVSHTFLVSVLTAAEHLRTTSHSEECIIEYLDHCYASAEVITTEACIMADQLRRPQDVVDFQLSFRQYCKTAGRIRLQFQLIELGFSALTNYLSNEDYVCQN